MMLAFTTIIPDTGAQHAQYVLGSFEMIENYFIRLLSDVRIRNTILKHNSRLQRYGTSQVKIKKVNYSNLVPNGTNIVQIVQVWVSKDIDSQ